MTDRPIPAALRAALDALQERLQAQLGPDLIEVRLFGSFARGEAHEDSDVDVAVLVERLDWARQKQIIDAAFDAGLDRGLRISPFIFTREQWETERRQRRPLVRDIEAQGILW